MSTSLPIIVKLAAVTVFVLGSAYVGPSARADSFSSRTSPHSQGFKHHVWPGYIGHTSPGYHPRFGYRPLPRYHLPYWGGTHIGRMYWPRTYVFTPYMRQRSGYPRVDKVTPAGRLVLKVHPEHALVLVDGYPLGQSEQSTYEIGLLVGEHLVEARAQGHHDYKESVVIKTGQRHFVDIKLRAH